MSKKKKSQKPKNNQAKVKQTLDASLVQEQEIETVETQEPAKQEIAQESRDKNKNDKKKAKKKDPREKGKFKRMAKESLSEIKNVVWPSFGDVVKKTGVVLAVVVVFAVVIFGLDTGLGYLMSLLKK